MELFKAWISFTPFSHLFDWFKDDDGHKDNDLPNGENLHIGTDDTDLLAGTEDNEIFLARHGDDVIEPGAGHDVVHGGRGTDTVRFDGSLSDFDVDAAGAAGGFSVWGWGHWGGHHAKKVTVRDSSDGSINTLKSVEVLEFDDAFYYLDGRDDPIVYKEAPAVANDDALGTDEETPVTFTLGDLLANDTGANGTAPTVSAIAGVDLAGLAVGGEIALGSGARLVRQSADSFIYDPNGRFEALGPSQQAGDNFAYTISDAMGYTATAQVAVAIDGVNDLPAGVPVIDGVAQQGEPLTASALGVSDAEGIPGPIDYQWEAWNGTAWAAIDGATAVEFVPTEDHVGQQLRARVSYTDGGGTEESVISEPTDVVDGSGGSTPLARPDTNANDAVVEAGIDPTTGELSDGDANAAGNVLNNDDGDGKMVVGVVAGPAAGPQADDVGTTIAGTFGTLILSASGEWTYELDNDKAATQALSEGNDGSDVFTYTMVDANGVTSTTTLIISIAGRDDPAAPVPLRAIADINVDDAIIEASTDANGNLVGGDATAAGNVLDNDQGVGTSVIGVAAGPGLTPLNDGVGTAIQGTYGTYTLGADGNWTYLLDDTNPATDALAEGQRATDVFTYTMADANGQTSTTTVFIIVEGASDEVVVENNPPVADDDPVIITSATEPFIIPVLANDSDPDGDPLTITFDPAQLPTGITGTIIDSNGDTILDAIELVPDAGVTFPAAFDFQYQISDGRGGEDTATVSVALNTPPTANPDTNDGDPVIEAGIDPISGAQIEGDPEAIGNVLDNDIDPDTNDTKTVVGVTAGATTEEQSTGVGNQINGTYGWLTLQEDGSWRYVLDDGRPATEALGHNQQATEVFTYTMADALGARSTTTLSVVVTGSADDFDNQPPQVSVTPLVTSLPEGTDTTAASIKVADIVVSDPDGIGDNQLTLVGDDAGLFEIVQTTNGPELHLREGAVLNFQDNPILDVTVEVDDPMIEPTPDDAAPFSLAITEVVGGSPVGPVTDEDPAGNGIVETAPAGTAVGITALATDPDPGDVVSYEVDNPRFQIDATGLVTVAPGATFDAVAEPQVLVRAIATSSDGSSSVEQFTISVTPDSTGTPEIVAPTSATSDEDTVLAFSSANGNPVSIAGVDPAAGLRLTITALNGELSINPNLDTDGDGIPDIVDEDDDGDGTVDIHPDVGPTITIEGTLVEINAQLEGMTYTPNPDENGTDTITYELADADGNPLDGTEVPVTINPINDAPVASDDTASTSQGTAVLINVLGNDTDVDGDEIIITDFAGTGNAVLNPRDEDGDGFIDAIDYIPNATFTGTDTFTYEISDGNGGTDTATVTVEVIGNQPPIVATLIDDQSAPEEAAFSFVIPEDAFDDPEGEPLTIDVDNLPGWLNYDPGTRTLSGTPDDPDIGTTPITVIATDPAGNPAEQTFNLTVTPVNDDPTGQPLIAPETPTVGTELTADLTGIADADGLPGDPGEFSYQWESFNGTVWTAIVGATGSTFTPGTEHVGRQLRVGVTYTDGQGFSQSVESDATAPVESGANEAPVLGGVDETAIAYSENDAAAAVAPLISITDTDDTNIESARVAIEGFVPGQDILAFDNGGSTIDGTFEDGVLTLAGSATLEEYQQVLRSVTYENASENPDATPRTISFIVNDGDNDSELVARNVDVTPLNDAPTGAPVIAPDTATVGTVLTATVGGIADADGLPDPSAFTYRWQAFDGTAWNPIDGATQAAFTPGAEHVDQQLRVVVSYTDGGGNLETIESEATEPVAASASEFLVFEARDETHGSELWVSDGTVDGTVLLKDIREGNGSSAPSEFTLLDNKLIFRASNGVNGTELWVTDGTEAGTVLLKDIRNGSASSSPNELVQLGDKVIFEANDGTNGAELWVTDGTTAGTMLLKDINANGSSSPTELTRFGDKVVFRANDGTNGNELWVTDGTAAGTSLLKDIHPTGNSTPREFTVLGDKLLFQANDGTNGNELWVTDGTEAGTVLLKNIHPTGNSSPNDFELLGDKVIFEANDGTNGNELWVTDGTETGTVLLKDINPNGNSSPVELTRLGDKVIFRANDGTNGTELWVTDGTEAGTVLLKDIHPTGNSAANEFTVLGDKLVFEANDGTNGAELWVTDGTVDGTMLLKDINSGEAGSSPGDFAVAGGRLYFRADDGVNGDELWVTDGTLEGTRLVKDLNTSTDHADPYDFTALGDKIIFQASDGVGGWELWATDGTAEGTVLIKDIREGSASSSPNDFNLVNDKLVFEARNDTNGYELWVTDGTAEGTQLLKDINPNGNSFPNDFALVNGKLVFEADDGTNGRELWVTDGTAEGTELLIDINPNGASNPSQFAQLDGKLFFQANDGTNGAELWVTDGTAAGTVQLADIHPTGSSSPSEFTLLGNKLIFRANDGTNGSELWVTDGTAAGTMLLKNIHPTGSSSPNDFALVNGKLVFEANDGTNGRELWVTDGTPEGTVQLADIHPTGNSFPNNFALVNGKLVFEANDGTNGNELWVTDGTPEGTMFLKDIHPSGSSNPYDFAVLNDKVLFVANDGTHGYELWVTDGTAAGTMLLKDILPGSDHGDPYGLMTIDGKVYFTANDGVTGWELWVSDGTAEGTQLVTDINTIGEGSFPDELIALNPLNDAPEGADATVTTDEETPYVFTVDDFGFSDPNDSPADAFTAVVIGALPPLVGALTIAGTPVAAGDVINIGDIDAGNLVFTPEPASNGTYTLDFQVQDNGGTVNGGVDLDPTPNTLTIDVTIPNMAPVASPVNLGATNEDLATVITAAELLAGVSDPDGPAATITDLSITSGNGTLQDNGNGSWIYTPAQDDDGDVAFSYTVTDGEFDVTSTASLDLLSVNDAPVAGAVDLVATDEEMTRFITAEELLEGITDIDGPDATITDLSIESGNGTLEDNGDNTWTYTPQLNDDTQVTFAYTASDGEFTSSSTATLDLTPVNDAPTGSPTINGEPETGTVLTAVTAGIDDVDGLGEFSFQWESSSDETNWEPIDGADAASFAPGNDLLGDYLRVTVSYTDGGGTNESLSSAATDTVFQVIIIESTAETTDGLLLL